MEYDINNPTHDINNIHIVYSLWTGRIKLWIDDKQIRIKKGKKHDNKITCQSGKTHKISVYTAGLDFIPIIKLDGKEFRLAKKLEIYEWVISALPLVMIAFGGALGGLLGACAFFANITTFRNKSLQSLRIIVSLTVSALSIGLYFLLAYMISSFL